METLLDRAPSKAVVLNRVQPDDCRGGVSRGLRGNAPTCLSLLDGGVLEALPPEMIPGALRVPLLRSPILKSSLARGVRFHLECLRALERPYPEAIARVKSLEEKSSAEGDDLSRLLLASFSAAVRREAEVAEAFGRFRSRS